MNNKNFKKIFLIFILILLFILLVFSVIFSILNINNSNILKGIYINNIDVSNLSKEQATTQLQNIIDNKSSKDIILSFNQNNEISTSFRNLGVDYDISSAIIEAYNVGRSGNIFQNNFEIIKLHFNKKNIDLKVDINDTKLNNLIKELYSNIENRVSQSDYYIDDNKLIISKGHDGFDIDSNVFIARLYEFLNDINNSKNIIEVPIKNSVADNIDIDKIYAEVCKEPQNAHYEKNPLKIYPEVIGISFDKEQAQKLLQENLSEYEINLQFTKPEVTLSNLDIDIFQDKLANFETKYNTSNTNRVTNLKLASSKINGIILSPGEEFSYNKIVGARSIDAGYKEAAIYSNGQVVDGIGGGICQISSTLYNSVVLANLEVTERHNHQFLTSYVEAGRDATVAYGSKDFKFKNNRSYPIKIEVIVNKGIVSCSVYGIKENNEYSVDFDIEVVSVTEPQIKYTQDETLSYGIEKIIQRGSKGMTVNVYKILKSNDNTISRTLLSQDTYKSLEKIIVRNNINEN